jgi:hypothetical protein
LEVKSSAPTSRYWHTRLLLSERDPIEKFYELRAKVNTLQRTRRLREYSCLLGPKSRRLREQGNELRSRRDTTSPPGRQGTLRRNTHTRAQRARPGIVRKLEVDSGRSANCSSQQLCLRVSSECCDVQALSLKIREQSNTFTPATCASTGRSPSSFPGPSPRSSSLRRQF